MDYNRVLRTLNNLSPDEFKQKISKYYEIAEFKDQSLDYIKPKSKH